MKTVLVTGGAGYVGSHCCKAFAAAGWHVVTLDNLSRGWRDAVRWGALVEGDITDDALLSATIRRYRPDLIAHLAAYAYVSESAKHPELYYRNNTLGTLSLLETMRKNGINRLLFSSTCACYGHPIRFPIDEEHPQRPINPYGWSKLIAERMLEDYAHAYGLRSISLRYFNAAGCDPEGEIGERHVPETHIIPLAVAAALRSNRVFKVNGTDFATRDGSAIRDYIHVSDLADAHVLAADRLLCSEGGSEIFNLGSGTGTTVLEILAAVDRATGGALRVEHCSHRLGDPTSLLASGAKAQTVLNWTPTRSNIDFIVKTALSWHRAHPVQC